MELVWPPHNARRHVDQRSATYVALMQKVLIAKAAEKMAKKYSQFIGDVLHKNKTKSDQWRLDTLIDLFYKIATTISTDHLGSAKPKTNPFHYLREHKTTRVWDKIHASLRTASRLSITHVASSLAHHGKDIAYLKENNNKYVKFDTSKLMSIGHTLHFAYKDLFNTL